MNLNLSEGLYIFVFSKIFLYETIYIIINFSFYDKFSLLYNTNKSYVIVKSDKIKFQLNACKKNKKIIKTVGKNTTKLILSTHHP